VPFPGFSRQPAPLLAPYTLLAREAAKLRRERYDVAVILRPDHWWGALLALAAGIPVRVGGGRPKQLHFSRMYVQESQLSIGLNRRFRWPG